MRNFFLGGNVAYATGNDISKVLEGAIGFFYYKDGVLTATSTGTEIKNHAMIVVGRPNDEGGPITIPFYNNNFSYAKGTYKAATKFAASCTIPAANAVGDYGIIIARKGTKFNERNKWTAVIHNTDASTTGIELCKKIAAAINNNTVGSGVKATPSSTTLNIAAVNSGEDYAIIGTDLLTGLEVNVSTKGHSAYGDASYIIDLANKAAADAGFEYTYRESHEYLYPNYPLNPLKSDPKKDAGFTIFTLKFSEPRHTKTHDQTVNQIVQIAFPTGAAAITTFETVCKALAGEVSLPA